MSKNFIQIILSQKPLFTAYQVSIRLLVLAVARDEYRSTVLTIYIRGVRVITRGLRQVGSGEGGHEMWSVL